MLEHAGRRVEVRRQQQVGMVGADVHWPRDEHAAVMGHHDEHEVAALAARLGTAEFAANRRRWSLLPNRTIHLPFARPVPFHRRPVTLVVTWVAETATVATLRHQSSRCLATRA